MYAIRKVGTSQYFYNPIRTPNCEIYSFFDDMEYNYTICWKNKKLAEICMNRYIEYGWFDFEVEVVEV